MAETTLYSLFKNIGPNDNIVNMGEDKIADTILSLIKLNVDSSDFHGTSPKDILIDEDTGSFRIRASHKVNPYYSAPEVLFSGATPSPESGFFTLAQLIFFVIHGKDYFSYNDVSVVELPENMRKSLIEYSGNEKINDALKAFSILDEKDIKERNEGNKPILEYICSRISAARIVLQATDTSGLLMLKIPAAGCSLKKGMVLKDKSGRCFELLEDMDILFHPGTREYHIKAVLVSNNESVQYTGQTLGIICMDDPRNITKLFTLEGISKCGIMEITRDKKKEYIVVVMNDNSKVEPRYRFNVPASHTTDCLLEVNFKPQNEVTVVVVDKITNKPMEPVFENTLTFNI